MKKKRLPPLLSLRAFEATARHMSFQKAASELGVTPTAVSHQVKILENDLGFPVFIRHTRKISLTEAGKKLFGPLNTGFSILQKAIDDLYPDKERKVVTLTAPTLFTTRYLIPGIALFEEVASEYEIRLHTTDDVVDLSSGGADIAVRCGNSVPEGFYAEDLIADSYGVLCHPGLALTSYQDLQHARLLISEHKTEFHSPGWQRWATDASVTSLSPEKGIRFTDEGYAIQAAVAGQGVMVGSLLLAQPELKHGHLVNPFGPVLAGSMYRIVTSKENYQCNDIRAVICWLHDCVRRMYEADPEHLIKTNV